MAGVAAGEVAAAKRSSPLMKWLKRGFAMAVVVVALFYGWKRWSPRYCVPPVVAASNAAPEFERVLNKATANQGLYQTTAGVKELTQFPRFAPSVERLKSRWFPSTHFYQLRLWTEHLFLPRSVSAPGDYYVIAVDVESGIVRSFNVPRVAHVAEFIQTQRLEVLNAEDAIKLHELWCCLCMSRPEDATAIKVRDREWYVSSTDESLRINLDDEHRVVAIGHPLLHK